LELVYLWVEKYKNIHEQGFNFSPKFNCHYDGEILTIKDNVDEDGNKQYIENFFGDNINVTAIVGKNGSGKSSVLKSLGEISEQIYYIFYQDNQLYSNFFLKDKNGYSLQEKLIDRIIYLNRSFFTELPIYGLFDSTGLYNKNLFRKQFIYKENLLSPYSFHNNLLNLIIRDNIPSDFFNPNYIKLEFKMHPKFYKGTSSKMKILQEKGYKYQYKIFLRALSIINETKDIKFVDLEYKQLDLMKNFCNQKDEKILSYKYYGNEEEHIFAPADDEVYKFLENFKYEKLNFLQQSHTFRIKVFQIDFLTKYSNIFFYLHKIGFLEYDFYDEKKSFSSLSTGEKNFFTDIHIINKELKELKGATDIKDYWRDSIENNILILLDEPDLTLHPNWQKEYIMKTLSWLKSYQNIRFHIIITTHSPFLLSDIPKQNIIFLDTYKKKDEEVKNKKQKIGNCKVLNHNAVLIKQQTFGANIHTLLSDSFFMEDGLMGEFAKSKIRTIKVAHRYIVHRHKRKTLFTQSSKRCRRLLIKRLPKFWDIQEIIGEPFLKTVIKNYLDEIENILFDNAKAKKMAIKRFIDEFGEDSVSEVLDDKA